ncbi:hypothetical protein CDD80_7129 [Ophiocordyceps camponoti-rufipedis]|uniref:Altered inheritance of mitochondria protein 13, mitochondrial n=1 Tax=Ophiocordyceps camponoti-rufipedis TaxID=2004952 RepID=A0A2C5ZE01_9HYPO|nr:hypothetical protein CDD80_7129 [Ophiocordyceps camponoti-rufipedis]
MGAGNSKPEDQGHQFWKSSGPPSLSLGVLDSLNSDPETNSSRAKQTELQIQARVAEELKKLAAREDEEIRRASSIVEAEAANDAKAAAGSERSAVRSEIEGLRRKLEQRKQLRNIPESVDRTRNEVVRCLRDNDRRPLDCWKEVQAFKAEVKKMEDGWVDRIVS